MCVSQFGKRLIAWREPKQCDMRTVCKNKWPSLVASGTVPGSRTARLRRSSWRDASLTPGACCALPDLQCSSAFHETAHERGSISCAVVLMTGWAGLSEMKGFTAKRKIILVNLYMLDFRDFTGNWCWQNRKGVRIEVKTLTNISLIFLRRVLHSLLKASFYAWEMNLSLLCCLVTSLKSLNIKVAICIH